MVNGGARNGDPLRLTAGKPYAPVPDMGMNALRIFQASMAFSGYYGLDLGG